MPCTRHSLAQSLDHHQDYRDQVAFCGLKFQVPQIVNFVHALRIESGTLWVARIAYGDGGGGRSGEGGEDIRGWYCGDRMSIGGKKEECSITQLWCGESVEICAHIQFPSMIFIVIILDVNLGGFWNLKGKFQGGKHP